MKKINVLFDYSVILDVEISGEGRAGIYMVTKNILQQFINNEIFNVTLFSSNPKIKYFAGNLPYLFSNEELKNRCNYNINVHHNKIKNTNNIFIIVWRYLKILKNKLYFFLFNIKEQNLNIDNYDIFFSPVYQTPDIIDNYNKIKTFIILHDCIPVLKDILYPKVNDDFWLFRLIQKLNKETYYFCVSECTKNDFLKIAPSQLEESKMIVTPIAASRVFFPKYSRDILGKVLKKYGVKLNPEDKYIFSFSTIEPRKNIFFTIKCFLEFIKRNKIDNISFYLGGGQWLDYFNQFLNSLSEFSYYRNKIILLGYINDEDVNILYSNSMFFVYLSQYEGFGIPPLEAMQAGTPVITSNNSSLPEVVGDAAITITYNDEEACIKAFENLYFSEELRKYYIEKGIERAKLFSWEKTFDKMSNVIINTVRNQDELVDTYLAP